MISKQRVQELIYESLQQIKDSDPSYHDVLLNDDTIVLGIGGPFDSVAFTALVTDLEEKIEDETGNECFLNVDDIVTFQKGTEMITVGGLMRFLNSFVNQDRGAKK